MTCARLCLVVDEWPEVDRERWHWAQIPAGFLEPDKPASHWSPARKRIVAQAYGQWLAALARNGELDPSCAPGDRATEARLREFVAELRGRVAPASASMMTGALLRMMEVLEPDRDWEFLARVYRHLKRTATPSRDKLACMVPATDLFELGLTLMDTCDDGPGKTYQATRYRDGLLIALLISCPMRLKNLTGLVIGRHVIFDGQDYRLHLTAAETKTGRPYSAAVPHDLTSYMDRWLELRRPELQSIAGRDRWVGSARDHLWLNRWGEPMSSGAIRIQIESRTRRAFGNSILPHLFRDCAVTELVDCAPEDIGIAPDLLGHADLQTTRKHYIQAQGMVAHARMQEVIAARRRAAAVQRDIGA
jgi:integrase/recombinase XerD